MRLPISVWPMLIERLPQPVRCRQRKFCQRRKPPPQRRWKLMNLSRNRTSLSLSLTLGLIGIGLARKEKPGGPSSSFPNLGFAHLAYAQLLSHLARHDEAFTEAKRARDL